jgi:hypothetical protein
MLRYGNGIHTALDKAELLRLQNALHRRYIMSVTHPLPCTAHQSRTWLYAPSPWAGRTCHTPPSTPAVAITVPTHSSCDHWCGYRTGQGKCHQCKAMYTFCAAQSVRCHPSHMPAQVTAAARPLLPLTCSPAAVLPSTTPRGRPMSRSLSVPAGTMSGPLWSTCGCSLSALQHGAATHTPAGGTQSGCAM